MMWKVSLLFSLAISVLCEHAISEQKLKRSYSGHHGDLSHVRDHTPEQHEVYAWAYPSYEFSYHVDDPHTHDQKGQREVRDGDDVSGSYWFIQPDGYKRVVKYRSNHKTGFEADVKYIHHDHQSGAKEYHDKSIHGEKYVPRIQREEGGNRKGLKMHVNKLHGDPQKRRDQGRKERRGRDHQSDAQEHREKYVQKAEQFEPEPQVNHYSKHGHRVERKPLVNRLTIGDHHEKYGHEIELLNSDRFKNFDVHENQEQQEERIHQVNNHKIRQQSKNHGNEEQEISDRHSGGTVHIDRDHDENEYSQDGDEHRVEKFWRGTYDLGKYHQNYKEEHRAEHGKDESWSWKKGRHEEHWKHGVLVGWTEGKEREVHRDSEGDYRPNDINPVYRSKLKPAEQQEHEGNEEYGDRRVHNSYQMPIKNFKPPIPYGQRLH